MLSSRFGADAAPCTHCAPLAPMGPFSGRTDNYYGLPYQSVVPPPPPHSFVAEASAVPGQAADQPQDQLQAEGSARPRFCPDRDRGKKQLKKFPKPQKKEAQGAEEGDVAAALKPCDGFKNNRYNNAQINRKWINTNDPLTYQVNALTAKYLSHAKFYRVEKRFPPGTRHLNEDPFSKDIWGLYQFEHQTEDTYRRKVNLWSQLYMFIKKVYWRHGLFLVGSTITGFGANNSDVDMCLLVRTHSEVHRTEAIFHLQELQKCLLLADFVEKAELIQAKIPLLKIRKDDLEVDLNCNNAVGIRNTHLLHCYASMDWRVRPLVLVVKLWARRNNINDAKNMTISSYSLTLMVIHYLQYGVTLPVVPCLHGLLRRKFLSDSDIHMIDMQERLAPFRSDNVQSLGELLLGFFQYYSAFDYSTFAISVRLGAPIPVEECRNAPALKNDPHEWKHLCIEEPFDLTNTARSVYDYNVFKHIKMVFMMSYIKLKSTQDLRSLFCSDRMDDR